MHRISLAWVIGASALVLAADFPWGDVQNHTHWAKVGWIPFVTPPVGSLDIIQNLLLCAPIGVAAALRFRRAPATASAIACVVSLVGESTQLYSHSRFPSVTDLVCNVTGAVAAALVVGVLGHSLAENS